MTRNDIDANTDETKINRRKCLSAIGGSSALLSLTDHWRDANEPDDPVGWDAPLDGTIKGVEQTVWWDVFGGHQVTGTVTFLDRVSGTLTATGRDESGEIVAQESKSVSGTSARITIKTGVAWKFIDIVEYRFD